MFCKRYTINLAKKDDVIQLRPLGDIHLGNLGCDIEKFKKNVDYIKRTPNAFTIGMGDYIDNVMAYAGGAVDKRWNPETVDREMLTTEEQIEKLIDMWEPMAPKTAGMLAGNHEWKTINQKRFITDFCKPLKIDYLGRLAYVNLAFKYKGQLIRDYLILTMHGGYSGMQAGGAVNRMKQIVGDFDCDVALMGHNHDCWTRPIVRTGYDKKKNNPIEKKVILANTGTFLRGYEKGIDSYVEINPREAKRVGTVTITFEPLTGDFHAHD